MSNVVLALRSIAAALLLPGLFAGYLPWRFFGLAHVQIDLNRPGHILGLAMVAAGAALLVACIWEFARSGRGTLAPVDPPRELVVRGLYRYVRNPMYLSVTMIVLGEVLLTRSLGLFIYWAVWFVAVNLFVMGYEEPALRRRFGESYVRYTERVHRWLPRLVVALVLFGCGKPDDRPFADMQERGREVMGVDQYASAHVFEDLPDGGRIVLETKDPSDTAAIAAIRRHMRDIQTAFRAGDFAKPFQVHAMTVPGAAAMSQLHDVIRYKAIDRPRGGEVRIRSTQVAAIAAVHEFLAFQREAHHHVKSVP